jgi:PKD repeat protein
VTLAGNATKGVVAAPVEQNPTKNGAAYITRTALGPLAKGIHRDAPKASFTYTLGNPNTLQVTVNAGGSSCSGSNANCDAYDWNWGDGTPNGSGVTATHTYATAGGKAITLTVHEYGVNEATTSRKVNVYAVDNPPTVASTCTGDANTWVQTLVDSSTDANGIAQVVVNWGDNTLVQTGFQNGTFTHTYLNAGSFVITHTAIDSTGQSTSETCNATFSPFTIGGTVQNASAVPLANALVQARKAGRVAATAYSAANGTFTLKNLKPGTYTVTVSKYGYTFPAIAPITVGPSSSGNTIQANP